MNDINIVKASIEHIDDIFKISSLSFPVSWSKDSIEKEIKFNSNANYLVAIKNNVIIGFGGLWIILDEAHITNIAVHPEYRGIGIGSMLLYALIALCKNKSVEHMTLEVRKSNIAAQNLYKKFNFIEEGMRKKYYSDNGEDALIMWNHNI
ncbi:ribosomal-protein-alanine N-acetyltransferase [Clostridium tetanomorphum]|uniref:[Ribosomal protein bS18]-alanine N-acetyltransferase n=1 Tax=Clostridium tetanomorphum TaxID=1553 RepID=A0A923EEL0_CLOTT|nr:ribosomal protein S18-alanine N-acetyltransferase [Clostridium tetanomorphum]KAJ48829.1 acetyltransferase [Clostridium tetanomorphum DSM 665]KAJ53340.1 acetyltransferase [Clostridium tetanomorphum DSM 665]MBC2400109.1 ribosomal protein S18-alanine N-acetyltransferase [Clostridium tetanomorphum]MBP1866291.1 ribosomal-protein-alanine N-acetyltransferase [Clostridium tetanomorphum]NRS86061.1 ribosomal-protein-alanine N-acetyltransferase [Clostridium tetanomorphum]